MARLRKSPRLKHFDYVGPFAYSLTLVTRGRTPLLGDQAVVDTVLGSLARSCCRHGFSLHAYCFMPDHLHLLVSSDHGSSLQDFVHHFKQLSGYRYKRQHGAQLWQISYYDHVLRRDEDSSAAAHYIWDNPIRAGLAQDRSEYPFLGPRSMMEQA